MSNSTNHTNHMPGFRVPGKAKPVTKPAEQKPAPVPAKPTTPKEAEKKN